MNFVRLALIVVLAMGPLALAQEAPQKADTDSSAVSAPTAPSTLAQQKPADDLRVHRFWGRENALLFSGIAASRALDYASTRNMQSRGREEILLPDDVVNNTAAFVAVEAGATLTSMTLSYLLHRTNHHKLERWLSIGHIGVTTFGAARNYALDTKR